MTGKSQVFAPIQIWLQFWCLFVPISILAGSAIDTLMRCVYVCVMCITLHANDFYVIDSAASSEKSEKKKQIKFLK